MQLQHAVNTAFTQLSSSIESLTDVQYGQPCVQLNQSSIGQHVRHIIEIFQCLQKGYETGVVNYEIRPREKRIETEKAYAIGLLKEIYNSLDQPDKKLILEGVYDDDASTLMRFDTNYYRELVYNLEHTIHHMALIRVGLSELNSQEIPENYGVASATVKYKKTCAQ